MNPKGHKNTFCPLTERSLNDYRQDIVSFIAADAPYAINLIGLTLGIVARSFGIEACNQIIEDFDLTKKYSIRKKR